MSRYKRRRLTERREAASYESSADDSPASLDAKALNDTQMPKTKSLFVHSLPGTATVESLTSFFSQSCPLKHATIVLDRETKTSKGYGFVTFADAEDAQRARETFNGSVFEGHKIKVEAAEPRRRGLNEEGKSRHKRTHASLLAVGSEALGAREQSDMQGPSKLIVRNLPWSIKQPEQLAALFTSYAEVKHAILPRTRPGLSAGFGFVMLRRRKDAEHAIQAVNGKEVEGRKLAVDWAIDKAVWNAIQKKEDGNIETRIPGEKMTRNSSPEALSEAGDNTAVTNQPIDNDEDESQACHVTAYGPSKLESRKGLDHKEEDHINQTLFIQNVPFTVTDEMLKEHFCSFGSLRYARVVLEPVTGRSRGVGFVCFYAQENADACLGGAPRFHPMYTDKSADRQSCNSISRSLLENYSADPTGRYTLEGRVLQISRAVQKREAERLTSANRSVRDLQDKDKRRLYLLSEGNIPSNSPLYSQLVASEIKLREESARQRQNLIKGNPSLHLSLTRLSIRNLSHDITSKALKALARKAVVGFATDVKMGVRQPLSKEEISRGGHILKEAEKARKAKGKGVVKQAKVIFEGKEGRKVTETSGAGRSRGYGFIEYTSHRWALMGLRWLNGRALEEITEHGRGPPTSKGEFKDQKRRLIVEFAIENSQVTGRRQEREIKARERSQVACTERESGKLSGSENQEMTNMRRKTQGTESSQNNAAIKPALQKSHMREKRSDALDDDNKVMRRQRIIGKKRMIRKSRKST